MPKPKELVEALEKRAELPDGHWEGFSGYAVIGLPFTSGHVLALRRFTASSLGPGYTSVWHRSPDEKWTFYQDVMPTQSCPRYFGKLIKENFVAPIDISWTGDRAFTVRVDNEAPLEWHVTFDATPATRMMNGMAGLMPNSWWTKPAVTTLMGRVAGLMLGAGRIRLSGRTPNGQMFIASPRMVWTVTESSATVRGEDLGPVGALKTQARLGEFLIPQRGIFAIAQARLEAYDKGRHTTATSEENPQPREDTS